MKWDSIQPKRDTFQFGWPDHLLDFAKNNSKIVRGHTLLWHSQLPQWVQQISDRADLKAVLEKHIATTMGRYRGRIYAWDVANEIFDEGGGFRQSVWSRVLGGDEMVRIAFEAARKADPGAKLYINDYKCVFLSLLLRFQGLETDGTVFSLDSASAAKTKAMASHVAKWRAAGIPIDGIGSQSHLKPGQASGTKAAMAVLCAAAPECAITELDIEQASPSEYAMTVKACVDIKNCVGVTVWGISDGDSWRKDKNPLMFDRNFGPKPAWNAVLEALR
jgi:endo-1,4-beta-xylanase